MKINFKSISFFILIIVIFLLLKFSNTKEGISDYDLRIETMYEKYIDEISKIDFTEKDTYFFKYDFSLDFLDDAIKQSSEINSSVCLDFQRIELEKNIFFFDKNIDIKLRKQFIADISKSIIYIRDAYDIESEMEFYITDKFNSCIIDEKNFIKYCEDNSISYERECISQILLGIFGENSNYGLIYGETENILNKVGFVESKNCDLKNIYKDEIAADDKYLDLIYPLFLEEFRELYQIKIVESVSICFTNYIRENYGYEELLKLIDASSEFDDEYIDIYSTYIKEFLLAEEIDLSFENLDFAQKYVRSSKLAGDIFRFNISTRRIDYKPINKLKDITYNQLISYIEKQINNVDKMILFWEENIDSYLIPVSVYLIDNEDSFINGYYIQNKIVLNSLNALTHELTHYFYPNYNVLNCLVEGRAEYTRYFVTKEINNDESYEVIKKEANEKFENCKTNTAFYDYKIGLIITKYLIDNYGLKIYKEIYYDDSKMKELTGYTIFELERKIFSR